MRAIAAYVILVGNGVLLGVVVQVYVSLLRRGKLDGHKAPAKAKGAPA